MPEGSKDQSDHTQEVVWTEYERVGEADVLQQGDLVRFLETCTNRYGIVVTADCDLDKRKHSRLVTLVPLLTAEQVICRCLAYDYFEVQTQALRAKCRSLLQIEAGANEAGFLGAVKARILADEIADPDHALLARIVSGEHLELQIEQVKLIVEYLNHDWIGRIKAFKQQIQSRGDLLILSPPPLVATSHQIAWLRSLWQAPVAGITLLTSKESEASGLRIAQLSSPYRYRLTQMLGQVFSDIGLPERKLEAFHSDVERISG